MVPVRHTRWGSQSQSEKQFKRVTKNFADLLPREFLPKRPSLATCNSEFMAFTGRESRVL